MRIIASPLEFVWDKGNANKNWLKHQVTNEESEEVFKDDSKLIFKDHLHSKDEERFRVLGNTKNMRLLLVVFTNRNSKIRIISSRDVSKKERSLYEKETYTTKI